MIYYYSTIKSYSALNQRVIDKCFTCYRIDNCLLTRFQVGMCMGPYADLFHRLGKIISTRKVKRSYYEVVIKRFDKNIQSLIRGPK